MTSFQALYCSPGSRLHTAQRLTGFCVPSRAAAILRHSEPSTRQQGGPVLRGGVSRHGALALQTHSGAGKSWQRLSVPRNPRPSFTRVQLYPRVRRDSEGWVFCLCNQCREVRNGTTQGSSHFWDGLPCWDSLHLCFLLPLSALSYVLSLPSPIPYSLEDFHLSSGLKVSVTDYSLFDYGLSRGTR